MNGSGRLYATVKTFEAFGATLDWCHAGQCGYGPKRDSADCRKRASEQPEQEAC